MRAEDAAAAAAESVKAATVASVRAASAACKRCAAELAELTEAELVAFVEAADGPVAVAEAEAGGGCDGNCAARACLNEMGGRGHGPCACRVASPGRAAKQPHGANGTVWFHLRAARARWEKVKDKKFAVEVQDKYMRFEAMGVGCWDRIQKPARAR